MAVLACDISAALLYTENKLKYFSNITNERFSNILVKLISLSDLLFLVSPVTILSLILPSEIYLFTNIKEKRNKT